MHVLYRLFCTTLISAAVFTALPMSALGSESPVVDRYASALASANGRLSAVDRRDLAERLLLLSSYYQIDPRLLLAVVSVESNWRSGATSPVGALGYGQLMPATAASLRVQPMEPYENLDGTARYLRRMIMLHWKADTITRIRLAAASYNAGPYAVQRYGGIPPYRETREYVARIVSQWRHFTALLNQPSKSEVSTLLAHIEPPSPMRSALRFVISDEEPGSYDYFSRANQPTVTAIIRKSHAKSVVNRTLKIAARKSPQVIASLDARTKVAAEPVVHYETSRSFFARALGMKHRVVEATPQPEPLY